jgi:hypothetical protein
MRSCVAPAFAALVAGAALFVAFPARDARAAAPAPPSPDAIFSRAKAVWRARVEAPFVAFNLRERYTWRGRVHDNWWHIAYRSADHALALRRIIVAAQEESRLKGSPISINLRFHKNDAHADSLDTNPDADAFPILDPLIDPDDSFGLLIREPKAALVGSETAAPEVGLATATPVPAAAPTPSPLVTEKPLRELARVEAVARDYTIALAGTERVRGSDTYHLTLTPLRDPRRYRLRDLWVDAATFATVQLAVQGLFEGKPYDDARWTVTYVDFQGRPYVQQIKSDDELRFGFDRTVTGLQFDFVGYDFPATLPALTFERLL